MLVILMVPLQMRKRKVTAGVKTCSSSSIFRRKQHEEWFENTVVRRRVVTEKGFDLKEDEFPEIQKFD